MTPTVAWVVIGIMVVIIFTLSYFVVKFAFIIFDLEDRVGDALVVLEEKEKSVEKILEMDLFYDNPQVRKVVSDIKACRAAIHNIIVTNSPVSNTSDEDTDTDVSHKG
jgi:hypothetical protein